MSDETEETRRRRFLYLTAAGATAGLAGCGGGNGGGGGEETESPVTETGAGTEGGTEGGTATGTPEPVPAEYETATAVGGQRRDPAALSSKAAVQYQSTPNNGNRCSGCQFYIPDQNGDGLGACTLVQGTIEPEGWCVSYAPTETESG